MNHPRLSETVRVLENHGYNSQEFQLYDLFDTEALETLVHSSSAEADVEVRFTFDDIRLAVREDDVEIVADDHDHT